MRISELGVTTVISDWFCGIHKHKMLVNGRCPKCGRQKTGEYREYRQYLRNWRLLNGLRKRAATRVADHQK